MSGRRSTEGASPSSGGPRPSSDALLVSTYELGHQPLLVAQAQAARGEPAGHPGIQIVFEPMHPPGQAFLVVLFAHRDPAARDNRPAVEFLVDEMDGDAMFALAGFEYAPVGMHARIFRQQGRVDIENPARLLLHESRTEDAHESRQRDEIGRKRVDRLKQGVVEGLAVRKVAMFDDHRRHARFCRALQSESRRIVANDSGHPIATVFRLIDERLQIRAVARDQHDDVA